MFSYAYHSSQHGPETNAIIGKFVSRLIWGTERGFGPHMSMSVARDGRLVAGVIYHNMDVDAGLIEISAASIDRRWFRPSIVAAMHWIPFDFLACQMAVYRVDGRNTNSIAQHRKFGCDEVVVKRGSGRDADLHIFTLTEEAWRDHDLYKRAMRG